MDRHVNKCTGPKKKVVSAPDQSDKKTTSARRRFKTAESPLADEILRRTRSFGKRVPVLVLNKSPEKPEEIRKNLRRSGKA